MHERQPHDNSQEETPDRETAETSTERGEQQALPAGEAHETEPELRPRVYVASLTDYNHGVLHGSWIDAAVEPDELHAGIQQMLANSPTARQIGQPAEEWAIHDYENFGPLQLGEYQSVEWITEVASGIAEHGPAFAAWAEHTASEPQDLQRFTDCYLGEWESVDAYVEGYLDDLGATQALEDVATWLQPYVNIDVGDIARDLQLGGDITVVHNPDGKVWIFEGR